MTSHCANPACSIPLGHLRDGRLFQFEVRLRIPISTDHHKTLPISVRKLPTSLSHFWLCGRCASTLTLVFDALKGVIIKPLPAA